MGLVAGLLSALLCGLAVVSSSALAAACEVENTTTKLTCPT
jgi:hypothetical protein